jgi:hypothetical protein
MLVAASPADDGGHPDWGWTEGERLDTTVFDSHRGEARALVEARQRRHRPWGFKDPRAALLLDFWLSLIPEAHFVLPYRPPWEVAESLQRLGAEVFLRRPDYAYRIWTFYNRHLLAFHRRHPDRSVLVAVDAAVAEPGRFSEVLGARVGLTLPADALSGRFQPELFTRVPPGDPLIPLVGGAYPDCIELLAELDDEAALPTSTRWRSGPPRAPRFDTEPLVGVVIPCHDDGELLIDAVASVERSIGLPHELIVVDDGSRHQRTVAILDLLRGAGHDVRRLPHRGLAAARNEGFAAARAPFVIPLDADNRLLADFVEPALEVLAAEPRLAAVYGDRVEFGARRGRVEVGHFDSARLVAGNYIDACAVIRRRAWEECAGYDTRMPVQGWEDWDLWLTLVAGGWSLRWLPLPGFEYRVRPDSMIQTLVSSPALPELLSYLLGKHHALYLASFRGMISELRTALLEAGRAREERDQAWRESEASRDRLIAAETALAESSTARREAERRVEDLAAEGRRLAERLSGLEEERDGLYRERRALHERLSAWRERTSGLDSTRGARLRRRLIRLRSRLEGRPRAGSAHPCVIGATGGSGTRVFARIAARGGLSIGAERNEFEDALPIESFLDGWVVPYWQAGAGEPPHTAPRGMDQAFASALSEQFACDADHRGPRGWKSPRSLYVLPFLAQRLPDLRFLHVVRDGRDMALSSNQLQLARYGSLLLTPEELEWSQPERSIALWNRINGWAADVGERLGDAYRRVRYEDLCARPSAVTREVFRFFDLPAWPRPAARLVVTPDSFGRWRRADPPLVARLEAIAGPTLARFGYPTSVQL